MNNIITINNVKDVIIPLRGEDVILAADVAKLYGVETKVINQAVKNNPDKFPKGFIIELTKEEKNKVVKNFDHLQSLKFT
ncbi:MAG: ORF6N domain-containing protein, partial [Muribaculaceae bacterium]|nr:ORF6N domain-containing protein [Muribaculaceae bacterium]